jgi:hypothetical protein
LTTSHCNLIDYSKNKSPVIVIPFIALSLLNAINNIATATKLPNNRTLLVHVSEDRWILGVKCIQEG